MTARTPGATSGRLSVADGATLARYCRQVLLDDEPEVDERTLRRVQAAHLDAFAYTNFDAMVGNGLFDRDDYLERLLVLGHGGICYQLNHALASVLRAIGFEVDYLFGTVSDQRGVPGSLAGNHLGLRVGVDGRDWLVDAGLGDGPREPLPLVAGVFHQGPFTYELIEQPDSWLFVHDRQGWFAEVVFSKETADVAAFAEPARQLVCVPEFGFNQTLTAVRRRGSEVALLRGRVFDILGAEPRRRRVLAARKELFELLGSEFGLDLRTVTEAERSAIWAQVCTAHEQWLATG